jgi:hypothetical protein
MKRIGIFGLSLLLFASCGMEQTQEDDINGCGCLNIGVGLKIALVDQNLQDRLNPEASAYFGDEYTQGIEVRYLYEGKKLTFSELWPYVMPGAEFPENYTTIQPPFMRIAGYDYNVSQNSLDYYFMDTNLWAIIPVDEDKLMYVYIQYPDGSEDEVKVQLFIGKGGGTRIVIDKIWFNEELVYDMHELDENPAPNYYNPAYYPFMEPVLVDDEGNQIGEYVRPLNASDVIVVIKYDYSVSD